MTISRPPLTLDITALTHDGRGIGTYDDTHGDDAGKKVFVPFALPLETVMATPTRTKKHFDEATLTHLVSPSPHRVSPLCPHFEGCGGCTLQHLHADEQIKHKEQTLAYQLARSHLSPDVWLPPIIGDRVHYRTKARLGVRYLPKTDTIIMGFRQKGSNFLMDIDTCPILDRRVSEHLGVLKDTLSKLHGRHSITHIEVAIGDRVGDLPSVALIIRHTKPLVKADIAHLSALGRMLDWQLFLQPKGVDSVHRIDDRHQETLPHSHTTPPTGGLFYHLPDFDLTLQSSPTDFTQVNLSVNRQMVVQACELLDLKAGERVLDLFCGLGNFSLAMAKQVGNTGQVIGVEGSADMVMRAKMNAKANRLSQAKFYVQDLTQDFSGSSWVGQVDALLIDPPRTGAWEVMDYLGRFCAKRIVYVSCDVATLVRDSVRLVEQGYRLTHAGVMDMFCHTGHVESMVRFEKLP